MSERLFQIGDLVEHRVTDERAVVIAWSMDDIGYDYRCDFTLEKEPRWVRECVLRRSRDNGSPGFRTEVESA